MSCFFFEISISILEELATVQRNVLSIRWFELDALNARNESEKLKKELSSNRPLQATRSLSFLQMVWITMVSPGIFRFGIQGETLPAYAQRSVIQESAKSLRFHGLDFGEGFGECEVSVLDTFRCRIHPWWSLKVTLVAGNLAVLVSMFLLHSRDEYDVTTMYIMSSSLHHVFEWASGNLHKFRSILAVKDDLSWKVQGHEVSLKSSVKVKNFRCRFVVLLQLWSVHI